MGVNEMVSHCLYLLIYGRSGDEVMQVIINSDQCIFDFFDRPF